MPGFESTEQLKDVFEEFWTRCQAEEEVMAKMAKQGVTVRFDIEEPEAHPTIDFKNPGPDGEVGRLLWDAPDEREQVGSVVTRERT